MTDARLETIDYRLLQLVANRVSQGEPIGSRYLQHATGISDSSIDYRINRMALMGLWPYPYKAKVVKVERLYNTWKHMRRRCLNPRDHAYHNYGGRGITVCRKWRRDYKAFKMWALANGYRDDLTIERKDNNKGYCPENCRWAPLSEQGKNTRRVQNLTILGETKSILAWSFDPRCQAPGTSFRARLLRGWEPERALTTPLRPFTKSL